MNTSSNGSPLLNLLAVLGLGENNSFELDPRESMLVQAKFQIATAGIRQVASISVSIIAVSGILLLSAVLMSANWVARWSPLLSITYSQVAAELVTLINSACHLLLNNFLTADVPCVSLTIESLRLAGMFVILEHVSALALLHLLALSKPWTFRNLSLRSDWVRPLLIGVWIVPILVYVVGHFCKAAFHRPPDNMSVCDAILFQSDTYRYSVIGPFLLPICSTLIIYMILLGYTTCTQTTTANRKKSTTKRQHTTKRSVSFTALQVRPLLGHTHTPEMSISKFYSSQMDTCVDHAATSAEDRRHSDGVHVERILMPVEGHSATTTVHTAVSARSGPTKSTQNHHNRRAAQMAAMILFVFLLCWLPSVIWFGLLCSDGCVFTLSTMMVEHPRAFVAISSTTYALLNVKHLLDAFIYALHMPQIRKAFRSMIASGCRKCLCGSVVARLSVNSSVTRNRRA